MSITIVLQMAARLVLGFICILVYMHILGKMQLAPTSPIDQIGNYVLGGIIGGIIYNTELPILQFFLAMFLWGALMLAVNFVRTKSLKAKRIIDGKPLLFMKNGRLLTKNLQEARISADDLISRLHQAQISKLEDIDTLWLEPNGQLTIVRKDDEKLAWTLIEDGQINHLDLTMAQIEESWLQQQLSKQGITDIGDVFCAQLTKQGLHLYLYDK